MENILNIITNLKIDPTRLIVLRLGGGGIYSTTELSPREFIRFSKEDIKEDNNRGLINSLTNSKRAIDCQIDNVFEMLGVKTENLKYSENLIKQLKITTKNLPFKLKLVQSLGLAPGALVSNVRSLRNKLEHSYEIPKSKEVAEAIEIAELFVLSIESKTKFLDYDFLISSSNYEKPKSYTKNHNEAYDLLSSEIFSTQIRINFQPTVHRIEITSLQQGRKKKTIYYESDSPIYYYLIRLINHLDNEIDVGNDLKLIFEFIKHPIPSTNIRLSSFY